MQATRNPRVLGPGRSRRRGPIRELVAELAITVEELAVELLVVGLVLLLAFVAVAVVIS